MEVEEIITRYGATKFAHMTEEGRAVILFEAGGRRVMFEVPLPTRESLRRYKKQERSKHDSERSESQITHAMEQESRQRWRALALIIKAKLEAVESGITNFEDEFLSHIVLPDGKTVGKWLKPQIAAVYSTGKMPPLLPAAFVERGAP